MRNPLRTAVSVAVIVAIIALRIWLRSNSTSSTGTPSPRPVPVEPARVIEETPREAFAPFPAGILREGRSLFSFAVFHDPLPLKPPAEVLAALKPRFEGLHFCAELTKGQDLPAATMKDMVAKDFLPPDESSLRYCGRGLSAEEGLRLQKCQRASVFLFAADSAQASAVLKLGHELLTAFAAETGGFLWDEETRECFAPAAWDKRGQAGWEGDLPAVSRHITIHSYRSGEMGRAVTLGMRKFGLPDVCANGLTESESDQIASLINIACQAMFETGKLPVPGVLPVDLKLLRCVKFRETMIASLLGEGTGKADLELALGVRDEGDADNRLIELRFLKSPGKTETERRVAFYREFFGGRDAVSHVEHDAELLAARDKAVAKIRGPLKAAYQKGLPPGDRLMVKAPFRTQSGGNEWMWVEVLEWEGTAIEGILMNDPFECPDLKSGARVAVKEESLFDYIHYFADGTDEGNETGKIMAEREKDSGGR